MSQANQLADILADLGTTADEVAANLKAQSIQGVRNTARFLNPVVRYAHAQLQIDEYKLDLTQPNTLRLTLPDGTQTLTPLPLAVKQFLDAFHRGAYPELELGLEGTG
jgi:hypothetical protein